GRRAASEPPPPLLLAWARKSAFSASLPLADCTRITSSDGSDAGGFLKVNVMPSAITACAISENRKVTPRRSAAALVVEVLTPVAIRSHRKAGRRYSARTGHPARAGRSAR